MSLKSFQFVQGGGGGGSGTVTQINTVGPITGGPITTTGNISLATSGVTANTYGGVTAVPVITVDQYGRITSAANVTISTGGVTNIGTDANLTGGYITSTGNIGLANVISFGQGNVALTNANVGVAIVNMNMLNAVVNNLNAQIPVQYATTASLTAGYLPGTLGVGATLTNSGAQAALTIDGYTFTAADVTNATRVLVKDQSTPAYNGAYVVTNQGSGLTNWVLTRATDYDQSAEMNAGDGFYVVNGTANKNTTWVQQTSAPITVGTTNIVFTQFAKVPTGSVTNVATSGNIAGGPITSTGTLSLTSNVVTINETQTLTNKRVTPRVVSITSAATITPTGDTADQYEVTALATTATIAAPSGTPTDGQKLIIRIKDNGVSQTLSWTTSAGAYRAVAVVLPTATVINSVFYAGCIYNSQDGFWDVVTTVQQ